MLYTDVSLTEKEEDELGIHPKFWEQEPIPISIDEIEDGFEKNSEVYNVTFDGDADIFNLNQKLYRNFLYVVLENKHRNIPNRKLPRHVLFIDEQDILNDISFSSFFEQYGYWLYTSPHIKCLPTFLSIDDNGLFNKAPFLNSPLYETCLNYCKFVEKYEIEHKIKIENPFEEKGFSLMYSAGYRIPMNLLVRLFISNGVYNHILASNCINENENIVGFGLVNLISLKKERNEMDRYVDFCYRKMCKECIKKCDTNYDKC